MSSSSSCQLLSGAFAFIVQGVLGFVALSSLLIKRHLERAPRPLHVWLLDVSKQGFGGVLIHFANIGTSVWLARRGGRGGDECAFYFENFFVDCTLGVVVVTALLRAAERAAARRGCDAVARGGEYGEPPRLGAFAAQLGVFCACLLANKLLMAAGIWLLYPAMVACGDWLFRPLRAHPNAELVVVMVLCPWLLTTLQFWLFDTALKARARRRDGAPAGPGAAPLLRPRETAPSGQKGDLYASLLEPAQSFSPRHV